MTDRGSPRFRRQLVSLLVAMLTLVYLATPYIPTASAAPIPASSSTTTFPAGSLVIDLGKLSAGATQQTEVQALRPYGLLFQLLITYKIPVSWAIADGKVAGGTPPATGKTDQTDFTLDAVYPNGVGAAYPVGSGTGPPVSKTYKSSAFVVSWDDLKAESPAVINALLTTWRGGTNQVTVDVAAEPITVPVFSRLTWWPKATLDFQNGKLAIPYYTNAGIPATQDVVVPATAPDFVTYSYKEPSELTACDDIFIMPHADPTWATHENLIAFNNLGGAIWAGCKAASVMENLDDPADAGTAPDMNFLTTNGMVPDNQHKDGSPPYAYTTDGSDPVMQFLGILDDATTNGAEQIYMPALGSEWRPTTNLLVWDPTQQDVPTKSAGPAAVVAYGRGFGSDTNGLVMYEAGHSLEDNTYGGAAQRAFFDFQLLTSVEDTMGLTVNVPSSMVSGVASPVSATITGGTAPYTYSWSTTGNGSFATASGVSTTGVIDTTYTPADTETGDYNIKLTVTDACGRVIFESKLTHVDVLSDVSITKADSPDPVTVGATLTYTIGIHNELTPGGPAKDVTVTDTVPAGLQLVSAHWLGTPPAGSACTLDGNSFTCTYAGDMARDAAASIEVTSTVLSSAVSPLVNTATVAASNDTNAANNQATASTVVVRPAITVDKTATPTSFYEPGGPVRFDVVVTNTSDLSAVTINSLTDSIYGDLTATGGGITATTCSLPQTLALDDTYSCYFTATVTGEPRTETDVVTASGVDQYGIPVSDTDDATVTINDAMPTIQVDKAASPTVVPEPGGTVSFTVTVTNPSGAAEAIYLDGLVDDVYGDLNGRGTCDVTPAQVIIPGASYSCTFAGEVAGAVGTPHTDTVTGTAHDNENHPVSDTGQATVTITDVMPAILVDKSGAPSSLPEPGGTATFTVTVTNPASAVEPITLDSLVDSVYHDLDGQGTCDVSSSPIILGPGAHYTCSFVGAVAGDAGSSHTDVVTATAHDNEGNSVNDTDDAVVTITDVPPTVQVDKSVSPGTLPEPGGNATFTITVTNPAGAVEPIFLSSLVDDMYGDLNHKGTCDVTPAVQLAPAASYTCSFTGAVSGDAGSVHTDIVTGTAHDNENNNATDTGTAAVTITDVLPTVVVDKSVLPTTLPEPGGNATFTVTVTNPASAVEPIWLSSLIDDVYGNLDGKGTCDVSPPVKLNIGASYSCTFVGAVAGDAGSPHVDIVTGTARDNEDNIATDTGTATVTITDVMPSVQVDKSVVPTTMPEPGGDATFTVTVTNPATAVESIFLSSLVDDVYGSLDGEGTCDVTPPVQIAIGGSYTCTFTGAVVGDARSTHTDVVTGTAADNEGNTVSDTGQATVTITDVMPTVLVDKSVAPTTLAEPGGNATFTVTVTNPANAVETIWLSSLVDDVYGNLDGLGTCDVTPPLALAAGSTYTCTFTGAVSGDAGSPHTDIVTGMVEDDDGNTATDTGTATVTITDVMPAIVVDKAVTPTSLPEPGGTATFTVTVTNPAGAVEDLWLSSLVDDVYGNLDGQGTCDVTPAVQLAAGDQYSCAFSANVSGDSGSTHIDVVTGSGHDNDGNSVIDTGQATVSITDVKPTVLVDKAAMPTTVAEPGGSVAFTVTVTNPAAAVEPVIIESLADDVYGNLDGQGTCDISSTPIVLPAGGQYVCTFTGAVSGDAGSTHTDTVTGVVRDNEYNTATDTGQATVTVTNVMPTIQVDKAASPTTLPEPGGSSTFTVTVTNPATAVEPIYLSSLVDDVYGNLDGEGTCDLTPPVQIAIGGSYSCSFTGLVAGDSGSVHIDTVTGTAEDNEHNQVTDFGQATVTITDVMPTIVVDKTVVPTTLPEPGGTATFTVTVGNPAGAVEPIYLSSLVDDVYGNLDGKGSCDVTPPVAIAVGSAYTCTFAAAVAGDAGSIHTDTVTGTAHDNEGNDVTDTGQATVTITNVMPSIAVDKVVSPTTLPEPGGTASFTVTVTNPATAVEPIFLSSLVDSVYGSLDGKGSCDVSPPVQIAIGGSYTCTFTGAVVGDARSTHTDVVTGTAADNEGNTVTDTGTATVTITDVLPTVSVDKAAAPTTLPEPGGAVSFTVTVTNPASAVEPISLSALVDDVYGNLDSNGTCDVTPAVVLDPGDTYTCTFMGDVAGDAGSTHTDTVTGTASDNDGNTATDTGQAVVAITDVVPSISVDKSVVPLTLPEPGGNATFTVTVTNPVDAVETILVSSLVDNVYGNLDGLGTCDVSPPVSLAAGATYTCTFTALVSGDAGSSHTDVVTGTAHDNEGTNVSDTGTATVTITDVLPTIAVDKAVTPTTLPEPGGNATFTVTVTNPASAVEPISLSALTDDVYGNLDGLGTCDVSPPVSLAAGATYTCSFTGAVSGDAGSIHTDVVLGVGYDNEGNTAADTGTATVTITDVLPAVSVDKSVVPTTLPEPGGNAAFTVTVTNPASAVEPIYLSSLVDDVYGSLDGKGSCDVSPPISLAPGASYVCTFTGAVAGDAGSTHTDVVTGTVTDNEGNIATDTGQATVTLTDVAPTIQVDKAAAPTTLAEPGGTATFTVTVTNPATAVESIFVSSLVDNVYGNLDGVGTCDVTPPVQLTAGQQYTCTFTGAVSGDAGSSHTDVVTGTAHDNEGTNVSDTGQATVAITDVAPAIVVDKAVAPSTLAEPGGNATFTVTVTNPATAVEPIILSSLVDDVYGNLDGKGTCDVTPAVTLDAGASYVCTFSGAVSGDAGSVHTDTVTGTAHDNEGTNVSDTGQATVTITDVLPAVSVDKSVIPATLPEPGGNATFTVTVTNPAGAVEPIYLSSLVDDVYGNLDGKGTCDVTPAVPLDPGATYTCTFTGAVAGDAGSVHTDTVTGTAHDNENTNVSDTGQATVTITDVLPAVSVDKSVIPATLPEPGGNATFTVTVTNPAGAAEPIFLSSLVDDVYGNLDGKGSCDVSPPVQIASGGSYTCTFTGAVSGDAGSVHVDTVTGTAADNEGNIVSDTGQAAVTITDVLPTISVDKSVTPLTLPEPGGNATFTVTVRNPASAVEPIWLSSLIDDVYGNLDGKGTCDVTPAVQIAIGASYTCTFTGAVVGDAGSAHTDIVTGTAHDNEFNPVSDTGQATVAITDVLPAVSVDKSVTPLTLPEPGGNATFTVTVRNPASAVEPIFLGSLVDSVYGNLDGKGTCDVSPPVQIAVGGQYICTFTGAVSGDAGSTHTDIVTGAATDNEGNPVSDTGQATVTITDVLPAVSVDKSVTPLTLPEPGGTATFTVTVTNPAGAVETIWLSSLVDDVYGNLDGKGTCDVTPALALSPGSTYTCTFTGAVAGDAGSTHTDTVTGAATDNEGNPASDTGQATVTITDVKPAVSVDKSVTPLTLPEPGGDANFTVTVTNPVSAVEPVYVSSLVDDVYGNLDGQGSCDVSPPVALAPGASYTCTFTGAVSGDAGSTHTDIVTGTVRDNENNSASDTGEATVTITDVVPTVSVDKSVTPALLPEPGGTATFTVTVSNPASAVEPILLSSLVDDVYGDLDGVGTCDVTPPVQIAIGASYTCTFTGAVVGDAGSAHTDIVTGTVHDNEGNPASDTGTATVGVTDVLPMVVVEKSASPSTIPEPGQEVTFTVKVINPSTAVETVWLTSLVDDTYGDVDGKGTCELGTGIALDPGESYTCTFLGEVVGDAGTVHTDTVTGTVHDNEQNEETDDDTADVEVTDVMPAIDLVKDASATVVHSGDKVTYTYTVRNLGVEPLVSVTVTDDKCSPLTLTGGDKNLDGKLDVTETWTYTCTTTLTGTTTNVGTATGKDNEGNTVEARDDKTVTVVNPSIVIDKVASTTAVTVGASVTYTYRVTNPSDGPLTDIVVTDDRCSPLTYVTGDSDGDKQLDPVETWAYTCTTTLTAVGAVVNIGTVTGKDELGKTVSATDTASVDVSAVLGEVITAPAPLPKTGAPIQQELALAALLLGLGAVFTIGGRRRIRRAR